jgi:hypothetical protein
VAGANQYQHPHQLQLETDGFAALFDFQCGHAHIAEHVLKAHLAGHAGYQQRQPDQRDRRDRGGQPASEPAGAGQDAGQRCGPIDNHPA